MNADLARAVRGPVILITLGILFAIDHSCKFRRHSIAQAGRFDYFYAGAKPEYNEAGFVFMVKLDA